MPVVVFDIGNVLLRFSFDSFRTFLVENGLEQLSQKEFAEKARVVSFETGQIEATTFFENIIEMATSESLTADNIRDAWNSIFTVDEDMFELLHRVSNKNPTYLLSNTNFTHWHYLERAHQLSQKVKGVLTSFEANSMKPDLEIYKSLIKKYSLEDEKVIFIDDLAANIEAAESLGWLGIQHLNAKVSEQALQDFGIRL